MNVKFSKYNGKTNKSVEKVVSNNSTSSSSGNEFVEVENNGLNRVLWGNQDYGDDLNETMWVNGNIHLGEWEMEYEEDEDGDIDKEFPILPKEEEDEGTGNIFASGKIEADSTYGKTVFLDYPERKTDESNKTDLLDILKKYDNAKIWGQGLKENNYNIVGTMTDVNDINFSGDSKTIGQYDDSSKRPNELYINKSLVVSSYNGNPWEVSTDMKKVGGMSYVQPTHISLNSITDSNRNGHYYNNPRVTFWVYNPTTLKREGHWWLGPVWNNDFDNPTIETSHKDFTIFPSFDNDYEDEENTPRDYWESFNITANSTLRAYKFKRIGGTDKQFLMADGSVKELDMSGFVGSGDVPTKVSQLENDVPYAEYDKNAPVILFSGMLESDNNHNDKTWRPFTPDVAFSDYHQGVESLTIEYAGENIPALKIKVNAKEGWTVRPSSVNAMVMRASDYNVVTATPQNWRATGYWMTGGVNNDWCIYLNAWRTDDDANDATRQEMLAFSVQRVSLTIFGYAKK